MSILKKYLLSSGIVFCSLGAFAQQSMTSDRATTAPTSFEAVNDMWKPSLVKDGVIDRVEHEYIVAPWTRIREADVAFMHKVWRRIDVRQRQNMPFIYQGDEYSGGGAFIEILIDAVKKGKVMAFSDERFTIPIAADQLDEVLGVGAVEVTYEDAETGELKTRIQQRSFNPSTVTKYEIKEEWVFDRNAGRLVVRIVGIAPLKDVQNTSTGDIAYSTPIFYIYYPDARQVLAGYEVYNPQNMVKRLNWTSYLDGRLFQSYVVKTSKNNPTGARMSENSLRSLELGRQAMDDIINQGEDMWEQ